MDDEWMGRYRQLVSALVRHVNVLDKLKEEFRIEIADGVYVDRLVWQIIEYFVEHRDNTENMIDIAAKLGIPQSSFSKKVKLLKEYGFIDRFIAEGNKRRSSSGRRKKRSAFTGRIPQITSARNFFLFLKSWSAFRTRKSPLSPKPLRC